MDKADNALGVFTEILAINNICPKQCTILLQDLGRPPCSIFFFFYLVCEAIGTAATPGL
jgi:hypothetical protein